MITKLTGVIVGIGFGFVLAWAQLTEPSVIHRMLLLREAHVFLVMGSAVVTAAIGIRWLRIAGIRAFVTGEPIGWSIERPQPRHLAGSVLFGIGWSIAGTCPGPVAVMIGEGRIAGLAVVAGLLAGIAGQQALARQSTSPARTPEVANAVGL